MTASTDEGQTLDARWITRDADLVAQIADEILREEAWLMAACARKYAVPRLLMADQGRVRPLPVVRGES